jgi:hypothetical protein
MPRLRRGRNAPVESKRLEEYDFYPFVVSADGHVGFSAEAFDQAVRHFLKKRNERAAQELIVIGQQNLVRERLPSEELQRYKDLYATYDGDAVVSDNDAFLENYKRIVTDIGRSFPNTGIEILLHDLVNPSRSLVAIENGAVTGRSIGSGATNLVLDLKTRRQRQLRIEYRFTPLQVHDHPDLPSRFRTRRGPLHQHRYPLSSRGGDDGRRPSRSIL